MGLSAPKSGCSGLDTLPYRMGAALVSELDRSRFAGDDRLQGDDPGRWAVGTGDPTPLEARHEYAPLLARAW